MLAKFTKSIFLLILFFSPLLYASNDADQPKLSVDIEQKSFFENNIFYQFINNHEYLLTPLSTAMAGAARCGTKCAVIGGTAGILDELAVYYGLADKRYLTWGIFGMSTGHMLTPSLTSDIGGFAVGVLLPTGMLNDKQMVIAPVASAIAGNSIGGTLGMVSGAAAGILDEILINEKITNSHYLTFNTIGPVITKLLGFDTASTNFITTALGLVTANTLGFVAARYEEETTSGFSAPFKTANNLYTTYSKFIPKEQLNNHIEKHTMALIGGQFLTQLLSLTISGFEQDITYHFEKLDQPGDLAWNNFKSQFTHFAIFIFPYAIGEIFSGSVDDYFSKKLYLNLEDKITSELFTGENALRLSHDPNNTVLIDNLKTDISTVVGSGTGMITGATSSAINGAYGVGIVIVNSPNIFIYSTLYNKAYSLISEYLAKQYQSYEEKIRTISSDRTTILKHDSENIRTITERGGIEVTKKRLKQCSHDLRNLEGEQKLWSMARSIFWTVLGTADYMLNYYLVGNEVKQGRIPFSNRNSVQRASYKASNLLSWAGRNAQGAHYVEDASNRINKLGMIILEGRSYNPSNQTDQINRSNKFGNQLILQDLEVGVENRMLVAVKDLRLEMGKVYAITGETGCGKTSLLSKIRGIKENGVYGKGYIYYPQINGKEPKILMLSQQDYFPSNYSLYEIISYPDDIPNDKTLNEKNREEINLLLEEIGLHTVAKNETNGTAVKKTTSKKEMLTLDSKKDWYTYLSGGEKKKIMIVSAIIKKPDIIILDEVFNGLDPQSTMKVQQVLKKHLPNTLILIVDHHAADNNYNAFYNSELHFDNQNITVHEIASK